MVGGQLPIHLDLLVCPEGEVLVPSRAWLTDWWRNVIRRRPAAGRAFYRPWLEDLEERVNPAPVPVAEPAGIIPGLQGFTSVFRSVQVGSAAFNQATQILGGP